MNRKLMAKILIDICLTVSLLLLMPYSLIGETAHEWIGMAMLVLFIVHHILNRKWIGALAKGRYTIFRIYQTLLVIAMLILMLGSMISGILLSNHIFKAVTIAGTTISFIRIALPAPRLIPLESLSVLVTKRSSPTS